MENLVTSAESVSFNNTENAFKGKTNAELNRAYWLFKLIGNSTLVKLGAKLSPIALKVGFKSLFKKTIYKQFVGGETIVDCKQTVASLAKYNIGTILDYSVEGKESEHDFENCFNETIEAITMAKNNNHISFCVFKVTGMARFALLEKVSAGAELSNSEEKEWEKVQNRVEMICEASHNSNQAIFIDAEESWIQPAIDFLAIKNMALFNKEKVIVYNTYQLYRHDRLDFLKQNTQTAILKGYKIGAKLVRGAYMEKERARAIQKNYPSPIQANKNATDDDYNAALNYCIENINNIALCAGTHNEDSSKLLVNAIRLKNISFNHPHIYFSQLLGMSDHISFNLSLSGYNVAKYVPYGPIAEVMPYLIRRAQENTSVKGQTGRELSLIINEKNRRKLN
ncbi:MAG: proline dehydrogenase family protein [Bacteroidetes bacterium]|nr:proline dehydrogenase family protein [Bacteroidota bacterium]